MQCKPEQVDLTAEAEAALQAHVRRCGGRVLTTDETTAAEAVSAALALVERTLAVLEHVGAAELPPIIHDRVPRL